MKTIPAALLAHYALGTTTLATAIRIERADGTILRLTSHDKDDIITGVDSEINGTYLCDPGFVASAISIAVGCDVGNTELRTLHDGTVFGVEDILGDRWRNAEFRIFRYNYKSYSDGVDDLLAGTFGEMELQRGQVVIELHDLRRYLNHPIGDSSSKTCRYRLGDDRCRKDISFSDTPFTVLFSVTNVTSKYVYRDSARAEAEDYFGEGEVQWLTGDNAGASRKVKTYAANGTFTMALPLFYDIQVGDTGIAIAGCRKRREEDCRDKFDNVLNFGGEPDRKGSDDLTKTPTAEAVLSTYRNWL